MSAETDSGEDVLDVQAGLRETVLADLSRISGLDFKTVSIASQRKAFRLEVAFWEALDAFCQREGMTRAQVLTEILGAQTEEDVNATSLIRTFLVAMQREKLREFDETFSRDRIITLLQYAPVAAFAMGRDKRMLRANREFLRLLRLILGDPRSELSLGSMRLTLAMPVEQIFEQTARTGEPVISGIQIEIRKLQRSATAKLVAVPGNPVEAVVGYIVL